MIANEIEKFPGGISRIAHKKEWLEMINTYNNTQSLIRDENILSYKENKLIKDLHNL